MRLSAVITCVLLAICVLAAPSDAVSPPLVKTEELLPGCTATLPEIGCVDLPHDCLYALVTCVTLPDCPPSCPNLKPILQKIWHGSLIFDLLP